jgi:hypothetical protein
LKPAFEKPLGGENPGDQFLHKPTSRRCSIPDRFAESRRFLALRRYK